MAETILDPLDSLEKSVNEKETRLIFTQVVCVLTLSLYKDTESLQQQQLEPMFSSLTRLNRLNYRIPVANIRSWIYRVAAERLLPPQ